MSPVIPLVSAAGVPWLLAQVPAALLTAGIYGILEGWLAVDGARDWWPMRPPDEVDDVDFGFLQADDLTGPGCSPPTARSPPGDPAPLGGSSNVSFAVLALLRVWPG